MSRAPETRPSPAPTGNNLETNGASAGVGARDPIPGLTLPEDWRPEVERSSWPGFIGALERHVRSALARASQPRGSRADSRPSYGGPGRLRPDSGKGPDPPPGVPGSEGLPTRLWFGPAFPNPSGGQVSFRVELPVAAAVRIAIVDIAGRFVGEIRAARGAGRHTLTWSGRGHLGPSGIYLARLEVDGRPVGVRRLVVLR